jgi:hypothetical protein
MNCDTLTTVSHTSSSTILFRLLLLDVQEDRNSFQQAQQPCHSELDEMVYNADDNTRLRARQIQRFNEYYPNQISANDADLAKRIAPYYFHERYNAEKAFPDDWIAKPTSLPAVLGSFRKKAEQLAKKLLGSHENRAVSLLDLQEEQEAVEHKPAGKSAFNAAPRQATIQTTADKETPILDSEISTRKPDQCSCKHAHREIDAFKVKLDKQRVEHKDDLNEKIRRSRREKRWSAADVGLLHRRIWKS